MCEGTPLIKWIQHGRCHLSEEYSRRSHLHTAKRPHLQTHLHTTRRVLNHQAVLRCHACCLSSCQEDVRRRLSVFNFIATHHVGQQGSELQGKELMGKLLVSCSLANADSQLDRKGRWKGFLGCCYMQHWSTCSRKAAGTGGHGNMSW